MNGLICGLIALTLTMTPMDMVRYDIFSQIEREPSLIIEYEETEQVEESIEIEEDVFKFDAQDVRTSIKSYVERMNEQNDIYVDPILAVSISRLETGNWSSKAYSNYNNFGGMMGSKGLLKYSTPEEGLEAFYKCLSWYKSKGMNDISSMSKVYCPDDGTWERLVTQIYKEESK